jgi:hypothetical protein
MGIVVPFVRVNVYQRSVDVENEALDDH